MEIRASYRGTELARLAGMMLEGRPNVRRLRRYLESKSVPMTGGGKRMSFEVLLVDLQLLAPDFWSSVQARQREIENAKEARRTGRLGWSR